MDNVFDFRVERKLPFDKHRPQWWVLAAWGCIEQGGPFLC